MSTHSLWSNELYLLCRAFVISNSPLDIRMPSCQHDMHDRQFLCTVYSLIAEVLKNVRQCNNSCNSWTLFILRWTYGNDGIEGKHVRKTSRTPNEATVYVSEDIAEGRPGQLQITVIYPTKVMWKVWQECQKQWSVERLSKRYVIQIGWPEESDLRVIGLSTVLKTLSSSSLVRIYKFIELVILDY